MLNLLHAIFKNAVLSENLEEISTAPAVVGKLEFNNKGKCEKCSRCLEVCPTGALTKVNNWSIQVDLKKCIACGTCLTACAHACLNDTKRDWPIIDKDDNIVLADYIQRRIGDSLHIRHLDAGSCNACDFEMGALSNPFYDISRFGIEFVASPRHADIIMVTGVITRNLKKAVELTYKAMPKPALVMAVGSCACSGSTYPASYAQVGSVDTILPVDIYLPGCPPTPKMMAYALIYACELMNAKKD